MAGLYELFVAKWLEVHLPQGFSIKPQEKITIDQGQNIHFNIDLVMYDAEDPKACCVLDTKYKDKTRPETSDIQQIVAYAVSKKCNEAVLIYPEPMTKPLDAKIGDIRVRSLTFSLKGDLEKAGQAFLEDLFHGSNLFSNNG